MLENCRTLKNHHTLPLIINQIFELNYDFDFLMPENYIVRFDVYFQTGE